MVRAPKKPATIATADIPKYAIINITFVDRKYGKLSAEKVVFVPDAEPYVEILNDMQPWVTKELQTEDIPMTFHEYVLVEQLEEAGDPSLAKEDAGVTTTPKDVLEVFELLRAAPVKLINFYRSLCKILKIRDYQPLNQPICVTRYIRIVNVPLTRPFKIQDLIKYPQSEPASVPAQEPQKPVRDELGELEDEPEESEKIKEGADLVFSRALVEFTSKYSNRLHTPKFVT